MQEMWERELNISAGYETNYKFQEGATISHDELCGQISANLSTYCRFCGKNNVETWSGVLH